MSSNCSGCTAIAGRIAMRSGRVHSILRRCRCAMSGADIVSAAARHGTFGSERLTSQVESAICLRGSFQMSSINVEAHGDTRREGTTCHGQRTRTETWTGSIPAVVPRMCYARNMNLRG